MTGLQTRKAVDPALRISAQRALLGAIGSHVRLVKVTRDAGRIVFTAICATGLTEEERESLSVAATEIIADFPEATIQEEIIVRDGPIPTEDVLAAGWVFCRAE